MRICRPISAPSARFSSPVARLSYRSASHLHQTCHRTKPTWPINPSLNVTHGSAHESCGNAHGLGHSFSAFISSYFDRMAVMRYMHVSQGALNTSCMSVGKDGSSCTVHGRQYRNRTNVTRPTVLRATSSVSTFSRAVTCPPWAPW